MNRRNLWCLLLAAGLVLAVPSISAAQRSPNGETPTVTSVLTQPASATAGAVGGPEGSVFAVGLLSYQPSNDYYVGAPYLDTGLGGVGAGIAAGVQVAGRAWVGSFEFSTAKLKALLSGRFVGDQPVDVSVTDTLISALVGYRYSFGRGSAQILGGPSLSLRSETFPSQYGLNGTSGSPSSPLALSAGIDVAQVLNPRLSIVETFRYSHVSRSD